MADEGFKRKLTAILSADVIGYSRLMRDDEEATVRDIAAHRVLISHIIEQHNGRVVDSPGDNLLAEFGSVVDAVNGAIKIQAEINKSNTGVPGDRRMEFRIGVNLGDVIEEEERIYGDGVNIAARVEGLAAGGGIAISGTVYEHIKEKLSLGYHYLGEQDVKNISEPVRVYRLLTEPADAGKIIGEKKPKSRRWFWASSAAFALILIVVGIFAIWNNYFRPSFEPASIEKMAFPLPDKPSIAVLPFDNMSGDPEQEYIADGLTENIITGLSLIPEMFVIARNSSFTYKGKPVKVNQVSEELGVRYVLEGSVQKSGDRLRVTAQLIDALKGNHLWAERYDRELKDLFTLQDEITIKVANALQAKLVMGEREYYLNTDNFEAWGNIVKAGRLFDRFTKEDNRKARKLAEKAIELDPDYAFAWQVLAWIHLADDYWGWSDSPGESVAKALEITRKTSKNWNVSDYHLLLSQISIVQGQLEKAISEGKEAVALNPNNSRNHYLLGVSLVFGGRPEEAIVHYKKTMRLEPYYPPFVLRGLARSYDQAGHYEEAISAYKKVLERALKDKGNPIRAHQGLAINYARLNQIEEARFHAAEILKIDPTFSVDRWRKHPLMPMFKNQDWLDSSAKMLRKAGLPENPPLKLPDKPSIAVLPFDNMSGDETQEYIADGITESIITALSKFPNLFVIARNSSFTYKDNPVKVQQVSRELGVRYVLEGSVQKSGDRIRINAQLIDAIKGHHLWAEKYDRKLKDIFALQDDITLSILKELQAELTGLGDEAAKETDNPEAYLKFVKGLYHYNRFNKEDNTIARELFKEAIALDPNYAAAFSMVGVTHYAEIWGFYSENVEESIKKVTEWAEKTLALDDSDAGGHYLMSVVYKMAGQFDKAIAEGKRAVELFPNYAGILVGQADNLRIANRPKEALKLMEKAMRLNPKPTPEYYWTLGAVYHMLGRYDDAVETYKPIFDHSLKYMSFIGHVGLTFAYLELGKEDEARDHAAAALKLRADSLAFWGVALLQYKDQEYLKHLMKPLASNQYAGAGKREVYVYEGTPLFKFEYPAGSVTKEIGSNPILSSSVLYFLTANEAHLVASVEDATGDMALADFGPKYYVQQLIDSGKGSNVKLISNDPFVLKDGTKAYRTEFEYLLSTGAMKIAVVIVSALKDNKFVSLDIHTTVGAQSDVAWIVESLTFE